MLCLIQNVFHLRGTPPIFLYLRRGVAVVHYSSILLRRRHSNTCSLQSQVKSIIMEGLQRGKLSISTRARCFLRGQILPMPLFLTLAPLPVNMSSVQGAERTIPTRGNGKHQHHDQHHDQHHCIKKLLN